MVFKDWRAPSYDSLLSEETAFEKDVDSSPLQMHRKPQRSCPFCTILPWLLSLILSVLLVISRISNQTYNTYQSGFATELGKNSHHNFRWL